MKAAVWHHPSRGPAFAALLPLREGQWPDTAKLPYGVPRGVETALLDKGEKPTWPQWGEHLTGRLPYAGRWTVEDVPDGITAHQVLGHVREQAASRELGGTSEHEPTGARGRSGI